MYTSHKYFVKGGAGGGSVKTYYFGAGNNLNCYDSAPIITNPLKDATTVIFAFRVSAGVTVENITFPTPVVIDLTQMFGAGNEPTTIDEFYSRIPSGVDINAYNEGEVINMSASGIKSVGRNAWDGVLEQGRLSAGQPSNTTSVNYVYSPNYIRVIPNAEYYASVGKVNGKAVNFYPSFYDENKVFLLTQSGFYNAKFTIPSSARYMRFFVYVADTINTSFSDICINLSDSSFNGQYEAYREATEDLSIVAKYFPNGMASVDSIHDEIRYNKQSNRWEKVVRIEQKVISSVYKIQSVNEHGIINIYLNESSNEYSGTLANVVNYEKQATGIADTTTEGWLLSGNETMMNALYLRLSTTTVGGSSITAINTYLAAHPITVLLVYVNPIVTEIEEPCDLTYEA